MEHQSQQTHMSIRPHPADEEYEIERHALTIAVMHGPTALTAHRLRRHHFSGGNERLFHLVTVAAAETPTGIPEIIRIHALASNEMDSGIPTSELAMAMAALMDGTGDARNAAWYAAKIIAGWKRRESIRLSSMLQQIHQGEADGDPGEIAARLAELAQDILPEPDEAPPALARLPFPTDVLPEPLQSMVRGAARQTNAPESLCAAAGLGISSASMGSAYAVQSGQGRETRGNLYLLAFADSGTGKGQSFNAMAAPWYEAANCMMEKWNNEERPRLLADLESAKADLERGKKDRHNNASREAAATALETIREAMKRKTAAEKAFECEPLLNIGNATAEAIAETLSRSPGEASAIISSEARDNVANLLGRYSNDGKGSDEAIFLQAYSGDPVTHKRKSKDAITLQSPCLTLCLAVQPDIWDRMAGDARLMESGFLARSMAFDSHAPPMRPSAYPIPTGTADAWRGVVHALLACRANPNPPSTVIPTPEAREVLDSLANEAADKREEAGEWKWCSSFASRLAENAWRLALVFHGIQHPQDAASRPLTRDTAAAAETVARWFFAETLALLSPIRSQKNTARMDKLASIFHDKQTDALPTWKLEQNHGFKEAELRTLAGEFPHRLRVVEGARGLRGGRPSITAQLVRHHS